MTLCLFVLFVRLFVWGVAWVWWCRTATKSSFSLPTGGRASLYHPASPDLLRLNLEEWKKRMPLSSATAGMGLLSTLPIAPPGGLPTAAMDALPTMLFRDGGFVFGDPSGGAPMPPSTSLGTPPPQAGTASTTTTTKKTKPRKSNKEGSSSLSSSSGKRSGKGSAGRGAHPMATTAQQPRPLADLSTEIPTDKEFEELAKGIVSNHAGMQMDQEDPVAAVAQELPLPDAFAQWEDAWDEDGAEDWLSSLEGGSDFGQPPAAAGDAAGPAGAAGAVPGLVVAGGRLVGVGGGLSSPLPSHPLALAVAETSISSGVLHASSGAADYPLSLVAGEDCDLMDIDALGESLGCAGWRWRGWAGLGRTGQDSSHLLPGSPKSPWRVLGCSADGNFFMPEDDA